MCGGAMFGLFKKKVPPGMIGETARITALFQEVKDQGVDVSLRIPGTYTWYNSKVVAIDPYHRLLAFNRIQEEKGHEQMMRIRRFSGLARCKGLMSFDAELIPPKEGATRYVIRMPELIEYQARRTSSASITNSRTTVTLMGLGRMLRGYLSSMSRNDIELRTRDIVPFQPGDEIASCTFELYGVSVSCRMKLLDTQLDTIAHETRLKGTLLDLPESQRMELDRAIAQLNQEQEG
jgi:hypothetical protein